jgi:predicted nucleotidyltransferase
MTEENFGLPASTLAIVREILAAEPRVEKAILFGSRAKGIQRPGSDIDLALVGEELDVDVLGRLSRQFEESSIPYQVDLCLLDTLDHPGLRDHIARVGKVLYERQASSGTATASR